jgi:hypothetical protein
MTLFSSIFTTGNQGIVENLTVARPLYNSFVLLYNETMLLDRSSSGLIAPPLQTHSNTTPDPAPDKTGNNREIEFKQLNLPSLHTPSLPTRLFKPIPTRLLIPLLIKQEITGKLSLSN